MWGHPRASIAALSVMTGIDRKGLHAIILGAGAVRDRYCDEPNRSQIVEW
jgi:hypothetical protein